MKVNLQNMSFLLFWNRAETIMPITRLQVNKAVTATRHGYQIVLNESMT